MTDAAPLNTATGQPRQQFPALTDAQVARVVAAGVEKRFAAGETVYEQGAVDVPFYVVLEGELELLQPRGDGEEQIAVLGPKEFTGEINLLDERAVLVSARAKSPLRAVCVEPSRLRSLIQTDPDLSEVLMRAFLLRRLALVEGGFGDVLVIGSRDSAATQRLQAFLLRNSHPSRYVDLDRDADVQLLLDRFHVQTSDVPILVYGGDHVLRNPSDAQVADLLGFNPANVPGVVHDVIICGAGPAGLAAAVYGASEGLDVLVIELSAPGGQAGSSSNIENYFGFPTGVSGQALAARGVTQAMKFGAKISVAHGATRIHADEAPIRVELAGSGSVCGRALVIATGAEYVKLDVPELARFEGVGVYYAATHVEAQRCSTDPVIVVGGGQLRRTSRSIPRQ